MIVAIPYVLLAAGFLFLGLAIQRGSILGIFDILINTAAWLISWGGLLLAGIYVGIVALAFFQSTRHWGVIAGTLVCFVAIAVIISLQSTRLEFGQWLFLLPCFAALALEGWLVFLTRAAGR